MLRIACGMMSLTKEKLAALAGDLERDDKLDDELERYDASIKFFRDMAQIVETAKLRLLVGSAVNGMRERRRRTAA
jgi:hypothetical protein